MASVRTRRSGARLGALLDTLSGWEEVSIDPFASFACGNMVPRGND
jgi:hypothetical protein